MLTHFIKLSCVNCGGELEIYDDLERFACGHCGAEMEVQRRGGTVALRVVTAAPAGAAPVGAAQVATPIPLKDEAATLSKQQEAMLHARIDRNKFGYGIGAGLMLVGVLLVKFRFLAGMAILAAGMFTVSFLRRYDKRVMSDVKNLQTRIDAINARNQR